MMDKIKISSHQFTILVSLFVIGDTILFLPSNVTVHGRQDAWISALFALFIGIICVSIYSYIGTQFNNQTLIEIVESAFGKVIGKGIGVILVFYFFIDCTVVLWQVGDFMSSQILIETPIQFELMIFLSIVIYAIRLGVETFARTTEILFPIVLILLILLFFFLLPQIDVMKIQPVFESGVKGVLSGSVPLIGYYFETIILLMIFPYVNSPKSGTYSYIIGMGIGSILLFMVILLSLLVLGVDITERNIFPSYLLSKKISIGQFLERIEVIMATIWILTLFVKLTICFYATSLGISQLLKLKDYKALLIPLAIITIISSLASVPNVSYFNQFVLSTWWVYTSTFGLFLPIVLLIMARIRKKKNLDT
ncbi:endospore germination permease [Bacillus sp. FJAT-47783]|uniref:GerAB/ArcD/ProY family transporter n=1 Tax=Bacillus sp. FJAT-47783 TaxID=2922712 RepID=UPI001FAE5F81|nr:endospore germination permease [Bacillus sp. FJAT-47783]